MIDVELAVASILVLTVSFVAALAQSAYLSVDVVSLYTRQRAGDKRAARALKLLEDKTGIVTALTFLDIVCDVVVTLIVGAALYSSFGFEGIAIGAILISLTIAVAFTLIPMAVGVVGSLPLTLSLSAFVAAIERSLGGMTRPLARLAEGAAAAVFRVPKKDWTTNELQSYIDLLVERGDIIDDVGTLLNSTLIVSKLTAADLVVSASTEDVVSSGASVGEALKLLSVSNMQRLVVTDDVSKQAVGFLTVRMLAKALSSGDYGQKILPFVHQPLAVNATDTLYSVMKKMSVAGLPAAFVMEEGNFKGVVTVTEIVDRLVRAGNTV